MKPSKKTSKSRAAAAPGVRGRSPKAARSGAGAEADTRARLELSALQGLRTIFGSARRHDADVRRIAGISGSQLWALSEIAKSAGLSVNDLSARMALHQTTASNLINALSERKLIRRERDDADQRVARLHITTDGKRMLLKAPGPYAGLLVDGLRHLPTSDLRRLNNAVRVLSNLLREASDEAAGETLMGE